MFKDGTYTAWFRTARGQGTGRVHLADGRISGGDSFFNYGGTYEIEGDRFTAMLTTKRFADGPTTVFGVDEVELKLSGMFKGPIASCAGTSVQAPDVRFEATLFLGQDQPASQAVPARAPRAMSASDIAKLAKLSSERYRAQPLWIRTVTPKQDPDPKGAR